MEKLEMARPMTEVIGILVVFAAALVCIVALRVIASAKWKTGPLEVKNTDMIIALLPVTLWLIVTGKVGSVRVGEVEWAFKEAAQTKVAAQVTEVRPTNLPVQALEVAAKGGVSEIRRLTEERVEALSFVLGQGNYYAPAIEQYLRELTASPFFKYVVVVEASGRFVGLADARALQATFASVPSAASALERWLNQPQGAAQPPSLPFYTWAKDAVRIDAEKASVLASMERLDQETLPVVDAEGRFVGVVDRSRLLSSLLLEVAGRLK